MRTYNRSIAEILGIGDEMRHQDPGIHLSKGGRYYIRPYVDRIMPDGSIGKERERIYLQATTKKAAVAEKFAIMQKINRSQFVLQAQLPFAALLDQYEKEYINRGDNLAYSTVGKYRAHLNNHIRPALATLMVADVTTLQIDALMASMAKRGLSWATRMDTRNLLCGIFTQAKRWGLWKGENPALDATVGRKRAKREKRGLNPEQIKALFAALPDDVRLICLMSLSCTLRISEVLGLQWKHIDFEAGVVKVRQRWYHGDLDVVKRDRSRRDVPLGRMAGVLQALSGQADDYVFAVKIPGRERPCRDDRDIRKFFLRPAAESLGLYYEGFGFHVFRRQSITDIAAETDALQAMRAAGHSRLDVTELYALVDHKRLAKGIEAIQGRVM